MGTPEGAALVCGTAQTRRRFVAMLPVGIAVLLRPGAAWAQRRGPGGHPEPRPGITAAKVLTRQQLTEHPEVAPVFDKVREMPRIVDGLRCHCGCAEVPGFYSLLTCYEDGMAQHCQICQGQAELAYDLFTRRASLAEIRAAIDARFG